MELSSDENPISAKFNGKSEILCGEHDHNKFPGLNDDLSTYARNWKGGGWDDIKVNVQYAEGTKILVGKPIVRPYAQPADTTVILASDTIRNDSSEPFETTIELKGTFENSITTEVEQEMSLEVAAEIGAEIKIFSASMSTTVSTTARKGNSVSTSEEVQFTRTVKLTVPPNKAFDVKMEALVESRKVSVTLPSRIEGPFRIQYPSRRDGHYYWISHISAAAKDGHQKTDMVTIVERGTAIDVNTVVTDAE